MLVFTGVKDSDRNQFQFHSVKTKLNLYAEMYATVGVHVWVYVSFVQNLSGSNSNKEVVS